MTYRTKLDTYRSLVMKAYHLVQEGMELNNPILRSIARKYNNLYRQMTPTEKLIVIAIDAQYIY